MTFDIYLKPNYSQKPPAEIKFGQPLTLPSIRYSTPSPGNPKAKQNRTLTE